MGDVCAAKEGDAEDLEPLRLVCDGPRVGSAPGALCHGGVDCDRGICLVAGTCVAACLDDDDCAPGDECVSVFAKTSPAALQPLTACVAPVSVPASTQVERMRLAEALTGAPSGDRVAFDGMAPDESLLLVLRPEVESGFSIIQRVETRGEPPELLFDLTGWPELTKRNPASPIGDPLTLLVPNGPDSVVTAAGYAAEVVFQPARLAPVDVTVTRLARPVSGTRLDLDLFYVGVESPSAEDGPPPPYVATALERLGAILAGTGLTIGDVRQHVVVGETAQELSVVDMDASAGGALSHPDIARLFRLSAGVGRPAVPIFLVRLVDGTLGLAGGIPGPQGVHGLAGSGVAISVAPLRNLSFEDGLDLGRVLAHELGHFLGLFHTTEMDGVSLEPLTDTPECPAEADEDEDGVLTGEECREHDAENLMFWSATGEDLSAQQADVIGRTVILQ
jgi:hypothetical protein